MVIPSRGYSELCFNKIIIEMFFQLVGELGFRENIFYGAIFLCMTLIVLFCVLIVNR
jgi:hypothetical protein